MNIKFIDNDYLLAWYLLFKPSFCEEIQALKERVWNNYSSIYLSMESENIEILKYGEDFIPDDNTIYDIVFDSEIFDLLKKETDKHRNFLMDAWDSKKKDISEAFKKICRIKLSDQYNIVVIHPLLDIVEYMKSNPKKAIAWGKKDDREDSFLTLMRIVYTVLKYEVADFQKENREMVSAILDMAINNELATQVCGETKYDQGFKRLKLLKKQLYPYWLMYLGADKEKMLNYMMRDKTSFELDHYQLEPQLAKVDIYGFIDFCCRNQKYIIRLNNFNN